MWNRWTAGKSPPPPRPAPYLISQMNEMQFQLRKVHQGWPFSVFTEIYVESADRTEGEPPDGQREGAEWEGGQVCAAGPQVPSPQRGGGGQSASATGLLPEEQLLVWGGGGTEVGLERCHSLTYSQCLRFWRGRRDRGMHPGKERELQTATPVRILRGGGCFLLAAARPVMGIYFPQLCALVPGSVHQLRAAKSGKGSVMKRSHARGCPALSEGLPGCGHTLPSRPAQADMRFPNPPSPCSMPGHPSCPRSLRPGRHFL